MTLRIGTRGSALARAQSGLVAAAIEQRGVAVETVLIRTTGDESSELQLPIEGKGIFTKELDQALRDGRIDLAVHSLKDLPTELARDLKLAAVPPREDPRDALITRDGVGFHDLAAGARIGTGSPRRRGQLMALRPDLSCEEVRGNVDTRIRRLREGAWDGIVLAWAGLRRLNREQEATAIFDVDEMIPAPGQGALALVTRRDESAGLVGFLDDSPSRAAVECEREILARLEGGCRAPVAAHAFLRDGALHAVAAVFSEDGRTMLKESASGTSAEAASLGRRLAAELIARGALRVVAAARAGSRA
jgi:hydroxymethylbilane synthase